MVRTFEDARRWMHDGTRLLLEAASTLDDAAQREPSHLPQWSRKTLLAHVAANADALHNLVRWAATGDETPMYDSPGSRRAGIEAGTRLSASELLAWLGSSADRLETGISALTPEQLEADVRTAQGRVVPASEIAWLRDRELFVHTVDLGTGTSFVDLPTDFIEALRSDITTKRLTAGEQMPDVHGPLADVAAYLAGRPHGPVTFMDGTPAPDLGPWL